MVTVATSDVAGGYAGTGNLDVDPVFVASGYWEHALNPSMMVLPSHFYAVWVSGDYHLTEGSPCVDAGDALSGYGLEPEPNGGQVNLGAYGNYAPSGHDADTLASCITISLMSDKRAAH